MNAPRVSRGEVWLVDLNPIRGHEQGGRRPGLIVSVDQFNEGPAELVVLVPLTTTRRWVPLHVEIRPPEGGVRGVSFAKCEDVRSVSRDRLTERWGHVSRDTMVLVEDRLRILLNL